MQLAILLGVPAGDESRTTAAAGGLVSYGASVQDGYRQVGAAFSTPKSQPTFRSCNPPNSNTSLTFGLPKRSVSACQPVHFPWLTR
jgi:hypothetical protein